MIDGLTELMDVCGGRVGVGVGWVGGVVLFESWRKKKTKGRRIKKEGKKRDSAKNFF